MRDVRISAAVVIAVPCLLISGALVFGEVAFHDLKELFFGFKQESPHPVILHHFVIGDGVFTVHLKPNSSDGRRTLCTNLPIVYDAVLDELYASVSLPAMQPPGQALTKYLWRVRQRVNKAFGSPLVDGVNMGYEDLTTYNRNLERMQSGSLDRCQKLKEK